MPGEDFIQLQGSTTPQCEVTFQATLTTVNGAASSVTQTLASTAGLEPGDKIHFQTTDAERTILTVDSATQVTLTATISTTNGENVRKRLYVNDIANIGSIRIRSDATSSNAELIFVYPTDPTTIYGRSWIIWAEEAVEPIVIKIDGGTSINGASSVTLSTTFGCVILHATSSGGWIAWALTAAA